MYKGISIGQHNLKNKQKSMQALKNKKVDVMQIKSVVAQYRKNPKLKQNNNQRGNQGGDRKIEKMPEIIQQRRLSEESDEDQLMEMIALYEKQKKTSKQETSVQNNKERAYHDNKIESKQKNVMQPRQNLREGSIGKPEKSKQSRISDNIKKSFEQYAYKHETSKQKPTNAGFKLQTRIESYLSKKRIQTPSKQKQIEEFDQVGSFRQKQQCKQAKQSYKQIDIQQPPLKSDIIDTRNKFTLHNLKQTNKPITCNYRIGDKQYWQSRDQIRDYSMFYYLKKFPKVKNFKNNQKAIIKCSLLKNDVFVCMPTGGGKSLTFQVMTFIQKGVYLCILPLVSLIMDQEYHAKNYGIKAFSLTGAKQVKDNNKIYNEISNYKEGDPSIIIFCTPQKISKSSQFNNSLDEAYHKGFLVKIVIDQVHCVSTWGKQFRQDYQNLSELRAKYPKTPILGLTATVTEAIKQDIINRLGIVNCYYFQSSFNRPNLNYQVREKKKNALNEIIQILEQNRNQSGIIYCLSRRQCEQMCQELSSRRYRVGFYHANISESQKRTIQTLWMENKLQIIIATIAFGMGINKPDVRFVIHYSLSKSLENYYQQSGRAGRDGEQAQCILFYKKSDKISLQNLIMKNELSDKNSKTFCMKQLSNMIRYCQDKYTCRRKFQLNYLGETDFDEKECAKTCDNCKRNLVYSEKDVINEAKKLVQFMMEVQRSKQDLSQNQLVLLCKGSTEKKLKYKADQIQRHTDVTSLRECFRVWNKQQIDELITQLCSFDIFNEKIVTVNIYKKNKVSNVYLKVNFMMANRFLKKVEILPMKRLKSSQARRVQTIKEYADEDLEFQQNIQEANDATCQINNAGYEGVSSSVSIIGRNKKLSAEDEEFLGQIFDQ